MCAVINVIISSPKGLCFWVLSVVCVYEYSKGNEDIFMKLLMCVGPGKGLLYHSFVTIIISSIIISLTLTCVFHWSQR